MSNRKIRLEEVEAIVYEHDVAKDGKFKKGFQIHLGRIAHKNGSVVAHACRIQGNVKWRYCFNPIMMTTLPICASCLHNLFMRADDRTKALLTATATTPACNTGVNSYPVGGS